MNDSKNAWFKIKLCLEKFGKTITFLYDLIVAVAAHDFDSRICVSSLSTFFC